LAEEEEEAAVLAFPSALLPAPRLLIFEKKKKIQI
jgi:hypothetical protein